MSRTKTKSIHLKLDAETRALLRHRCVHERRTLADMVTRIVHATCAPISDEELGTTDLYSDRFPYLGVQS